MSDIEEDAMLTLIEEHEDYTYATAWDQKQTALFLADLRAALAAHDAQVRAEALAPIEMLTDPEEMGRAMWKASGLNEDLILLAQEPAANALRAVMEAKG